MVCRIHMHACAPPAHPPADVNQFVFEAFFTAPAVVIAGPKSLAELRLTVCHTDGNLA